MNKLYFRRQHPIAKFIVDFYCHELMLVIEVDGSVHDSFLQKERDINRTTELENFDIKVIRFTNNDVIKNTRKVAWQINDEVKKRLQYLHNQ